MLLFVALCLILGKRYGIMDLVACTCMSMGLIFFSLADSSISPSFNIYGKSLVAAGSNIFDTPTCSKWAYFWSLFFHSDN